MPRMTFTKTGNDIFDRVKTTFSDESAVQFTSDSVLRWINDAQREVVESNDTLLARAKVDIQPGVNIYPFSGQNVHHIQSIHYNGEILEALTFQDAQTYVINNDAQKASGCPLVWYEYDGDITIWPKPDRSIPQGLVMYFSEDPEELTAMTDRLAIPDIYFNAIFAIVMRSAYFLDENWTAVSATGNLAKDSIERLSLQEAKGATNLYPFPSQDPEDLDWGGYGW